MGTGAPESFLDVLLLPSLLAFFGFMWYAASAYSESQTGEVRKLKWLAYIPLIFATWSGGRWLWSMWNPTDGFMYRDTIVGRKVLVAHYLAFLLPVLTILIVFIWGKIAAKRRTSDQLY